jgi:hypothetical protein
MGTACSTYRKDRLRELGRDKRIMLKRAFKNWILKVWNYFNIQDKVQCRVIVNMAMNI